MRSALIFVFMLIPAVCVSAECAYSPEIKSDPSLQDLLHMEKHELLELHCKSIAGQAKHMLMLDEGRGKASFWENLQNAGSCIKLTENITRILQEDYQVEEEDALEYCKEYLQGECTKDPKLCDWLKKYL